MVYLSKFIIIIPVNSVSSKPKAAGVDDGFKGEGAACGTSVVKVSYHTLTYHVHFHQIINRYLASFMAAVNGF